MDSPALYAVVADWFEGYAWPGNVRELQNFVERLIVNCAEDGVGTIDANRVREILPELFIEPMLHVTHGQVLKVQEEQTICDAMTRFNNDKARVAEYLGISTTTLWRRLKAMGNDGGKSSSETQHIDK